MIRHDCRDVRSRRLVIPPPRDLLDSLISLLRAKLSKRSIRLVRRSMRLWLNQWLTICTRAFQIFAHFCTTKSFQVVWNNTCAKVELAFRSKWSVPLIGDWSSPAFYLIKQLWPSLLPRPFCIFVQNSLVSSPPPYFYTKWITTNVSINLDSKQWIRTHSYINFNSILQIKSSIVAYHRNLVNLIDSNEVTFT